MCGKANIFDDGKTVVSGIGLEELKEMAKNPETVEYLVNRVKTWIKHLSDILKESDQIRRENDSSGKFLKLDVFFLIHCGFQGLKTN